MGKGAIGAVPARHTPGAQLPAAQFSDSSIPRGHGAWGALPTLRVRQVHAGIAGEAVDLLPVDPEAHGCVDADRERRRHGGTDEVLVDAEGDDLLDAVVLDIVDLGFDL